MCVINDILDTAQDGAEYDRKGDRVRKKKVQNNKGLGYGKPHMKRKPPINLYSGYSRPYRPFPRVPIRNMRHAPLAYHNLRKPVIINRMGDPTFLY